MSPISGLVSYNIYADGGALSTPIGADPTVYSGAYFCASNSSSSTAYVEYSFDLSAIPAEAEIDSVSCLAGGSVQTSYYSQYVARLYSGSTAKGSEGSLYSQTTNFTVTIDGGAWTRDELKDCRVRFTGQKNSTGTTRRCYVNGARITVTYTYNSEKFMLKIGSAWRDVSRVFKKVSGIWVEQTELSSVVEDGVRYQDGGEYVSPNKTVTITGSGDSSYAYVTINGTKYISPATVSVPIGTVMTCTVSDQYFNDQYCYISVDGVKVLENAIGSYNHTVTTSCAVTLVVTQSNGASYGYIEITTQ